MRFIVLGDLHYALYSRPEIAASRDRAFETMFRQVASHKADLVFAIGDTTNEGKFEELEGQTALAYQANVDLLRITGNHDMDGEPKDAIARFFLGGRPSNSTTDLYTAFSYEHVRFVLLDTSRSQCSNVDWSGYVSPEQLAWLNQEVEQFNASPNLAYFFVLGHHPITNTTLLSDRDKLNITNSEEVQAILNRVERTPAFYICGHNHCNSLASSADRRWHYVQCGAPLITESYRLFDISAEGVEVSTVEFNFDDATFRHDFDATRDNFEGHFTVYPKTLFYGQPQDLTLKV